MGTVQSITLELPKKAADNLEQMSAYEKQLFIKILSSWLSNEKLDTGVVMDFIGYRAQKRGLTPEILEQILKEENP
ncbi:MAG: hypothetical protein HC817_07240 [Saprospiraceae bacterium]|nr:hypothetical protein [Saprospiraceae bacterium]